MRVGKRGGVSGLDTEEWMRMRRGWPLLRFQDKGQSDPGGWRVHSTLNSQWAQVQTNRFTQRHFIFTGFKHHMASSSQSFGFADLRSHVNDCFHLVCRVVFQPFLYFSH